MASRPRWLSRGTLVTVNSTALPSELTSPYSVTTVEKMPKVGNRCPFPTSYHPVASDRGGFPKSHQTSSEQKLSPAPVSTSNIKCFPWMRTDC